jgi:hypothetical protein
VTSPGALTFYGIAISAMFHFLVSFTYAQVPAIKPPMIVGNWKLNPEKSGMGNVPLQQLINMRQYRMRPDGFLVGLLITTDPQGGYHYLQFTAKSDGRDYPEYSDALLAEMIATSKPTTRMYAERIINDYTTEWIDKVNGRISAQGKKVVSQDGTTLTITTDGQSRATVYDRQ